MTGCLARSGDKYILTNAHIDKMKDQSDDAGDGNGRPARRVRRLPGDGHQRHDHRNGDRHERRRRRHDCRIAPSANAGLMGRFRAAAISIRRSARKSR